MDPTGCGVPVCREAMGGKSKPHGSACREVMGEKQRVVRAFFEAERLWSDDPSVTHSKPSSRDRG